jgi:hypothetical protein
MNARESRTRRRKPLAAGVFQPEISSFRLALAAEGKAAKTVRNYTEAVQWFAAAHLLPQTCHTGWEQVSRKDIQWWLVWLLAHRCCAATAPAPAAPGPAAPTTASWTMSYDPTPV